MINDIALTVGIYSPQGAVGIRVYMVITVLILFPVCVEYHLVNKDILLRISIYLKQ